MYENGTDSNDSSIYYLEEKVDNLDTEEVERLEQTFCLEVNAKKKFSRQAANSKGRQHLVELILTFQYFQQEQPFPRSWRSSAIFVIRNSPRKPKGTSTLKITSRTSNAHIVRKRSLAIARSIITGKSAERRRNSKQVWTMKFKKHNTENVIKLKAVRVALSAMNVTRPSFRSAICENTSTKCIWRRRNSTATTAARRSTEDQI